MVTLDLAETTVLTGDEKRMLKKAKELPVIYNESMAKLTNETSVIN